MKSAAALILGAMALFSQDHPVEGNAKSTVRVIAYEDLQCPDCAVYGRMVDEVLLPKYGKTVAFERRDFPLAKHKWAKDAAVAARHFDRVSAPAGSSFRRWLFANQKAVTPENFTEKLSAWAASNGQDAAAAKKALADSSLVKLVEADVEEGVARGVARTPTVFVNGEPFIETFTAEAISKGIDAALAANPGK